MIYKKLGTTDIKVSFICLGSMNWGEQNTENDAYQQLDYAIAEGINFIDTAEMYPIPPHKESQGLTEQYIGSWMKKRKNRNDLIIASKVTGRSHITYIRNGKTVQLDRKNIRQAIEGSLKRLQTDYIDLYQVHFPDRQTNYFGKRSFAYNPHEKTVPLEETLSALNELIREGKVKYIGVSNETAWGLMEYVRLNREKKLPKVQSIQNAYSLIMREYETALSEITIKENISLLPYSPLAHGVLTGKYLGGVIPEISRFKYSGGRNADRYNTQPAQIPIRKYVELAKKHGLDPAQMALAFVNSRPFVTSTIIGATTMKQLKTDIDSIKLKLSNDVLSEIEAIHYNHPNPIT